MAPPDPENLDPGLARERTRLAWVRTAIAFAAVAAVALRREAIIGLAVLAVAPLIWLLGHVASREARPGALSRRRLLLLTVAVTVTALLAITAVFLGGGPASLRQLLPRHG